MSKSENLPFFARSLPWEAAPDRHSTCINIELGRKSLTKEKRLGGALKFIYQQFGRNELYKNFKYKQPIRVD